MDSFTIGFLYIVLSIIIGVGGIFLFLLLGASTVWFNDKANDEKLPKDVRKFFLYCGLIVAFIFIGLGIYF